MPQDPGLDVVSRYLPYTQDNADKEKDPGLDVASLYSPSTQDNADKDKALLLHWRLTRLSESA